MKFLVLSHGQVVYQSNSRNRAIKSAQREARRDGLTFVFEIQEIGRAYKPRKRQLEQ
jgi:hypothetical protein